MIQLIQLDPKKGESAIDPPDSSSDGPPVTDIDAEENKNTPTDEETKMKIEPMSEAKAG